MNIVYLVFGNNRQHYIQAAFSIMTLIPYLDKTEKVIVITDNRKYFNFLKDRLLIIDINADLLNEWKGKYDFFWRIKIKALQLVAEKWENSHILYLDSDTFFFKDISYIREKLNSGSNLMHLKEGELHRLKTKTERSMWRTLKYKQLANILISKKTAMWNAGLIGIPKGKKEIIDLSLKLCDQMSAMDVTPRLIEQFAFSVALSSDELHPADNIVGHYWGNKEQWHQLIDRFFINQFLFGNPVKQQIEEVQKINFKELPYYIKTPSTRLKLIKLLNKVFPNKNKAFIS